MSHTPVSRLSAPILRVLLYEGPGASPLSPDFRGALLHTLLDRVFPVSCLHTAGPIGAAARSVRLVMGDFTKNPPAAPPQMRFQQLDEKDPAHAANLAD